jgi:hypothetical protein
MRLYKIQATSTKVDVTNRSDDISLNAKVDESATIIIYMIATKVFQFEFGVAFPTNVRICLFEYLMEALNCYLKII